MGNRTFRRPNFPTNTVYCVVSLCLPITFDHDFTAICASFDQNGVLSRATEPTRRDTTMTFTTFVMFDMFNALCCRSADKIVPQMDLLANKAFLYSVGGSLVGQVSILLSPEIDAHKTERTESQGRLGSYA